MTKQNRIHKKLCEWEKSHKDLLKSMCSYRSCIQKNHKRHNRKFWWQWNKDYNAKRIEIDEETGDYYAVVFNKQSKVYTTYKIISDNDALKLVGEYSVC